MSDLMPVTYKELEVYATKICNSSFCPSQFKGKPNDILIAIQMGSELGLKPLQAIQNIAVINGKPSIYGDALVAIVRNHPDFEWCQEECVDDLAICKVKRKNQPEHTASFSVEDAKRAGLWGKSGPWSTYPKRMLQHRARGFAFRDVFADALKGFITAEEAEDYPKEKYMGKVEVDEASIEKPKKLTIDTQKFDKKPLFDNERLATEEEAKEIHDLFSMVDDEFVSENFGKSSKEQLINEWFEGENISSFSEMKASKIKAGINRLKEKIGEKKNDAAS